VAWTPPAFRNLIPVLLLVWGGILGAVPVVYAGTCGDDVAGVRVPCGCGDVVVSDTRLRVEDPVVTSRCSGDGLILRAASDATSLRLDLGGQTLMGEGRGVGVRVLRGGTRGAVIVGGADAETAVIANFGTGLRASNPRMLAELRGVRLSGNARDGAYVRTHRGVVTDVVAEHNGRDGLRLGGRALQVQRVEASRNARYGVVAAGRDADIDARAQANGRGDMRTRAAR